MIANEFLVQHSSFPSFTSPKNITISQPCPGFHLPKFGHTPKAAVKALSDLEQIEQGWGSQQVPRIPRVYHEI